MSRNNKNANKVKQPYRKVPIIPLENIKTERVDDYGELFDNNNNRELVHIKTEPPDEDDDASVIFVPTPSVTIKVNNSIVPPPQKRAKLNNGKEKVRAPTSSVAIKREPSSPKRTSRNPVANSNAVSGNIRYRNRSTNQNFFKQQAQPKKDDDPVSERIFKKIQPTTYQMSKMVRQFQQEITNLFAILWFKANKERDMRYINRLIVAKIKLANLRYSPYQVYQDMRKDIVKAIQNYQIRYEKTPHFYNAFVDGSQVVVMCADSYAYDCLCEYINSKYYSIVNRSVNIEFLPCYFGRTLYCYAITVNDIVYDTRLFINQLQLHCSDLNANNWITVRYKVHELEGYTSFVFFMDETSSLTIDHVYSRNLCICMLAVKFFYCGEVPCNI